MVDKNNIEEKKMSELTGENSARLSEKERKLVSGALTIANKIPGIGAMITAGKTFKAVKNAIDNYNETKPRTGPDVTKRAKGGLMEATAKLKAKGFKEGGMVIKDKTVAMDKSPNSGLITQRGFGASRRT